jgi:hypothetical protein
LRALPPYELVRVVDFISGRKRTRKVAAERGARKAKAGEATKEITERFGVFRNVPRSMKTEIARYLREREANPDWFDSTVLVARKALKRLYALLHVRPGERAQRILFDDDPPPDSRLYGLRELARAERPDEQAHAIVEHRIPYRVAATVVRAMTPEVVRALVEVMSPQELINSIKSLKERGALEDAEVKAAVEAKLARAKDDRRVSAYKASVAAEAAQATGDLAEKLEEVTEARVKAKGEIRRPTALLIDKSGSMHDALEVGRQLGSMISAVCRRELFAYAFDSQARLLDFGDKSLAGWEKALAGLYAGGATSCGAALDEMRSRGQRVEQLIFVTDGNENREPYFRDTYEAYAETLSVRPAVIVVKVGRAGEGLERDCQDLGVAPTAFTFEGDYYALTNLIPLLSQPSLLDLMFEIMEYPLPRRVA